MSAIAEQVGRSIAKLIVRTSEYVAEQVPRVVEKSEPAFVKAMDKTAITAFKRSFKPELFQTREFREWAKKVRKEFAGKHSNPVLTFVTWYALSDPERTMRFIELVAIEPARIFYNWLLDFITPKPPVTFDKAKESAARLMAIALDVNMAVSAIDFVAAVFSLGQLRVFGRALTNIVWSFGIGFLTWVVMSPPLMAGIGDPMRSTYASQYRPRSAPIGTWERWLINTLIDEKVFEKKAIEWGYPDDEIDLYIADAHVRRMSTEYARLRTIYLRDFVEGTLGRGKLLRGLAATGLTWKEADILADAAEEEFERSIRKEWKEIYVRQFLRHRDETRLREDLAKLKYSKVRIDVIVELAKTRLREDEAEKERKRLEERKAREEERKLERIRRLRVRAAVERFEEHKDKERFREELTNLKLPEDEVEALVDYHSSRLRVK